MRTESTPGARGPVFCGVDTHADSHWLCVLDWRGRKVLSRQFPADAAGYEALAGAIAAAGEPACVAMEGTSSYGAGLTRHLASLGMPVREALSPARTQRRRPGQGKCDEADAERAARAAMSGSKLGTPKSQDGWVDGVRCMLAARSGAVKARTSAINTARSLLTTAPEGLRSRFRGMGGPRLMEELPSVRAEGALGAALGRLFALSEAYPDLKANQNFLSLQSELSDIENKIAAARRFYNSSVAEYNAMTESVPAVFFARSMGFQQRGFFELPEGERAVVQTAPTVKF